MLIGRNDSCVCGSGKKYKKCCMLKSVQERLFSTSNQKIEVFPVPIQKEQYFLDRGVREFLLANLSWGLRIIKQGPLDRNVLIKVIDDLRLFAFTQNQIDEYIAILKATFKARKHPLNSQKNAEFYRLANNEPSLMLNEQHLLQEIVVSCKMELELWEFTEPDYGIIYTQLEFAFLVIRDVLLEKHKYLEHVQLIIDVKDSKEFLSNWSIKYQNINSKDLDVPEPVYIGVSHLNEAYNTLQMIRNEYNLLEESTKKNISTAIYYTENLSDEVQQYLTTYDTIILALIISVERELRVIIETANKCDLRKTTFIDLINQFYEKYNGHLNMFPIEGIHELRKLRNQVAHAQSEATRADFLLVKKKLIDNNFFMKIQQIKTELHEEVIWVDI